MLKQYYNDYTEEEVEAAYDEYAEYDMEMAEEEPAAAKSPVAMAFILVPILDFNYIKLMTGSASSTLSPRPTSGRTSSPPPLPVVLASSSLSLASWLVPSQ